ncbi:hypothetical protein GTQ40_05700 [Flavobacteriaceae bacterium R38]|nr:hypothetical protein [Flavobacteriaceae bacterium R38]
MLFSELFWKRIKAVIIDYLIMILIGVLVYEMTFNIFISCFICYPLAINKDFLNGKSIGKRIFGIQVQDLSNFKANEWKSSLRNILFIIPIEFFVIILNPKRRIGDHIARTKIGDENTFNLKSIQTELKEYRINKELIFGVIFGILNIYLLLSFYGQISSLLTK